MLDVVQAAIDSARPTADAKDIRLKVLLDPVHSTVSADSGRLQQVVWNLLANAIKFTPKGGQVQVLLQRVNSHVELSVSDTGIGIPANFLPHVLLFLAARQLNDKDLWWIGSGAGDLETIGGTAWGSIRASSQGEGKGATFFVDLPVSIVQLEDQREQRSHPTAQIAPDESVALPKLFGVHAFVVDDEPDARDLLQLVFQHQGAEVTSFATGKTHSWRCEGPSLPSSSAISACPGWTATSSCGPCAQRSLATSAFPPWR